MATTNVVKLLDECYLYAQRLGGETRPFVNYGDYYHVRVTGASAVQNTAGTEADDTVIGDVLYVVSLNAVRSAAVLKVGSDAGDTATFVAGDPAGTCKKVTLAGTLAAPTVTVGTAGDEFMVLKDPGLSSADVELARVQSKSETEANPAERPVYDTKGRFTGIKKLPRSEPNALSITEHYEAFDRQLSKFKGHRFHLMVQRDDNRAGTITETEYYWNGFFPNAAPNESVGDTNTDVSFDVQYLWKGIVAG